MLTCTLQQDCKDISSTISQVNSIQAEASVRLRHQRYLANQRERKRMMLINRGFEQLRAKIPICELEANANNEQKSIQRIRRSRLTKVDILRLTIDYIKHLTKLLNCCEERNDSASGDVMNRRENVQETRIASRMNYFKRTRYKAYQQRRYKLSGTEQVNRSQARQLIHQLIVNVTSDQNIQDRCSKYILSCSSGTNSEETRREDHSRKQVYHRKTILWIPEKSE